MELNAAKLLPYPEPHLAYGSVVEKVSDLWRFGHNFVVLSGPPGTGKTRCAEDLVAVNHYASGSSTPLDQCRISTLFPKFRNYFYSDAEVESTLAHFGVKFAWDMVVLHPQYAYEDLIRGYRLEPSPNGNPGLAVREGILGFACRVAEVMGGDPKGNPVATLILDEINRAPIGQLFGEALFAIDRRDTSITTPYDLTGYGPSITVPKGIQLIGTMNSVDRATAMLDLALRRRMTGIRIQSDRSVVENAWSVSGGNGQIGLLLYDLLKEFVLSAKQVSEVGLEELVLGHSYFLPPQSDMDQEKKSRWLWKSYAFRMAPALKEFEDQGLLEFDSPLLSRLPLGLGLRLDEIGLIDESEAINRLSSQLNGS